PQQKKEKKQEPKKDPNGDTISEAQQRRMFALAKDAELAKRVLMKYGYTSSKEVKKADYEKICTEIEAAGKAG
ncbi:MAG: hypothetical protein GX241_07140, partial [Ruminococcaceae bacterium]|nr:hypothetical protein [Oscillospiraceae bacterium]